MIQQFLAVRKDFPPVYDYLESNYIRTKRLADAEHLLQLEIAALPKDARPRLQLASLYRTSGRYREMSQALQTIISDRANFPAGPALVGDFYAGSQKWDDALATYRAGIQASPDNKDAYHKRIERALEALGKRQEALGELNEILKDNPKDPDARLARAVLLRQSQDAKERDSANAELKALAVQYPSNAVLHYNLGSVVSEQRRYRVRLAGAQEKRGSAERLLGSAAGVSGHSADGAQLPGGAARVRRSAGAGSQQLRRQIAEGCRTGRNQVLSASRHRTRRPGARAAQLKGSGSSVSRVSVGSKRLRKSGDAVPALLSARLHGPAPATGAAASLRPGGPS